MKKPVTKFARPTPRYDLGGLIADFSKSSTGKFLSSGQGRGAAGAFGAATDAIGSGMQQQWSGDGDEQYQNDINKLGGTNRTINTASNIALASGNPLLMAAGGVGKIVGMFDFDKGARKAAEKRLETRKYDKALDASSTAGAKNINALPEYKAPAYGRRGLKLKKSPSGFRMGGMSFTSKFAKPC